MTDNIKNMAALAVTVALLVAGGVLIMFMLGKVSASEGEWARYVYLYGGVEAIVFAAVGWLFGKLIRGNAISSQP